MTKKTSSDVSIVKCADYDRDRVQGAVRRAVDLLGGMGAFVKPGSRVLIKPNFNTADLAPGSTHNETLASLVEEMWKMGAKSVTIGERSYPPTKDVMEQKGVIPLLRKLDAKIINFDDLEDKDWVEIKPKESHWQKGFRVARPVL